ncbi:MAG: lipopolysaccharide biosynthesis protein [Bacteroidota bacterium]
MIRPFSQRSEFLRHTTQLLVGTSLAQGLVFVIQPVLSRLFTTSDYAIYGVFITLLSWLEIISTGRYELATVIPKHDRDAINLVAGTSLLSTIIAILSFVVVVFFGQTISSLLKLPELLPYLYLLPVTLLIWSIVKMLNSWLVRKESFKASSVNKMVQKSCEQGSSIIFGFISFHGGLIIGDFIGRAMMLIVSIRQSIKVGATMSMLSWKESLGIMKQFYRYPLYNTLPALLNTTATLLPVFYMTSKYPGDPAGNFIFSRMVLMAPISFLAFSISQVLLQKVAKNRINNLSIKTEILFLLKYLGLIGFGLIIIFLVAGPSIFEFVFGKRWLLAGTFSQIMVISYATQFLVSPISSALAAMEKIKLYSLWQAGYFLAIGCLFFVKEIPVKDFILLLTSIEVLFYLVYLILILWVVRKYEHSISTIPAHKL